MTAQEQAAIFSVSVIGALTVGILIGKYSFERSPGKTIIPATISVLSSPSTPVAVTPRSAVSEQKLAFANLLATATVKRTEGIEHPLIRQLMNDPTLVDDPKEKFQGNRADIVALKRWAGRQAHLVAIKAGYVDWKFGAWIYVYPDRIAYILRKGANGHLQVDEVSASPGTNSGTSLISRPLAASVGHAQFLAWPNVLADHPLPGYEHLWHEMHLVE